MGRRNILGDRCKSRHCESAKQSHPQQLVEPCEIAEPVPSPTRDPRARTPRNDGRWKFCRGLFALLIGGLTLDLLSMVSWGHPAVAGPLLAVVAVAAVVAASWDIRLGVAIVLLELLWGSHGRLLAAPVGEFSVSLRMVVFVAVLFATIWHLRQPMTRTHLWNTIRTHPARWPALALGISVLLALVVGALRHPTARWFTDANAWAFLLLVPAFLLAKTRMTRIGHADDADTQIQNEPRVTRWNLEFGSWNFAPIVLAGALYLILRTYLLLFLFSHDLGGTWIGIYQWVRDTRLGEVTIFPGGFPRIFLPSMVLLLVAIPLAAMRMRTVSPPPPGRGRSRGGGVPPGNNHIDQPSADPIVRTGAIVHAFIFGGSIALLTISLSRSYWVGLATLGAVGLLLLIHTRITQNNLSHFRTKMRKVVWPVSSILLGLVLAVVVVRLPWPQPLTTAGFGATLAARFAQDAAVSNRWQQIEPLRDAIMEHPILGSGFGAAVTYESKDPRTLAAFPDGRYTTTAFEWGYLDDLLERGIVGLLVELWLIAALIVAAWRRGSVFSPSRRPRLREPLAREEGEIKRGWGSEQRALAIGLLAIAVVHATSPYLNHPLGIGAMLLLVAATVSVPAREECMV